MEVGILRFGGYVPQSRLQRAEILKAHGWFNPGLRGLAKGERAMANWDEDPITMAFEASRDCLAGRDRDDISALYMASTSFPFLDRQNAGVVASALDLGSGVQTIDLASSQRAGTSALSVALKTAASGDGPILVAASEKRRAKAASPLEMTSGDGAAALLVGTGDLAAKLIGAHTETTDFVDHFRSEESEYDYTWEERWVRDEGYMKIVPSAVSALLEKTGVAASDISRFCFPAANVRVAGGIAKALGIAPEAVADTLQATCGEAGTAHALILLVHALESAKPGDRILVASFGQGCDALLFEATDAIAAGKGASGVSGHLARRFSETNYAKFQSFNGLVTMERGIRSEIDKNTGLSTHHRNVAMTQGFVGGKCTKCGTNQFPKSNICVNPNCNAVGTQVDEPFADKAAQVNSYTADQLTYSPNPPNYFGMIQFEGGGRLLSDFTDVFADSKIEVGMPMKMMFRVKDYDEARGFRRYFWKAAPRA